MAYIHGAKRATDDLSSTYQVKDLFHVLHKIPEKHTKYIIYVANIGSLAKCDYGVWCFNPIFIRLLDIIKKLLKLI